MCVASARMMNMPKDRSRLCFDPFTSHSSALLTPLWPPVSVKGTQVHPNQTILHPRW